MARSSMSLSLRWPAVILAVVLGVAVVIAADLQRQRVLQDVERSYVDHVEDVARLVSEGVRGGARTIEMIYLLSEEHLATSARLLHSAGAQVDLDALLEAERVRVWAHRVDGGGPEGRFGPVPEAERGRLFDEVLAGEEGELLENRTAVAHGLYCAHFWFSEETFLVCKERQDLVEMRRSSGVGTLLDAVAERSVLYAALQDDIGVIAASPGAGTLSTVGDDPFLAPSLEGPDQPIRFRQVEDVRGPLFEGIASISLPDETTALLRVGVDATALQAIQERIDARHQLLVSVVVVLLLSFVGASWGLGRLEQRRHRAEQRLAVQQEEHRHWQTIGQMASTVAHEVRNPLNAIGMVSQRLGREFEVVEAERPAFEKLVGMLRSEAERVNRLVCDFLELGRPLQLNLEETDVASLVPQLLQPARLRAEQECKQIEVDVATAGVIPLDRTRFAQVLINLVNNALDAMSEGGRAHIVARLEANELSIVIDDDGEGMDAETLASATEPFMTTKRTGVGLGLPLARRLTEAHGGQLIITSQPGVGTRVELRFPRRATARSLGGSIGD